MGEREERGVGRGKDGGMGSWRETEVDCQRKSRQKREREKAGIRKCSDVRKEVVLERVGE